LKLIKRLEDKNLKPIRIKIPGELKQHKKEKTWHNEFINHMLNELRITEQNLFSGIKRFSIIRKFFKRSFKHGLQHFFNFLSEKTGENPIVLIIDDVHEFRHFKYHVEDFFKIIADFVNDPQHNKRILFCLSGNYLPRIFRESEHYIIGELIEIENTPLLDAKKEIPVFLKCILPNNTEQQEFFNFYNKIRQPPETKTEGDTFYDKENRLHFLLKLSGLIKINIDSDNKKLLEICNDNIFNGDWVERSVKQLQHDDEQTKKVQRKRFIIRVFALMFLFFIVTWLSLLPYTLLWWLKQENNLQKIQSNLNTIQPYLPFILPLEKDRQQFFQLFAEDWLYTLNQATTNEEKINAFKILTNQIHEPSLQEFLNNDQFKKHAVEWLATTLETQIAEAKDQNEAEQFFNYLAGIEKYEEFGWPFQEKIFLKRAEIAILKYWEKEFERQSDRIINKDKDAIIRAEDILVMLQGKTDELITGRRLQAEKTIIQKLETSLYEWQHGMLPQAYQAIVIRKDAPVYEKGDDVKPFDSFDFGKRVNIIVGQGKRVRVEDTDHAVRPKWIERSDMLPVQNATGIRPRLWIKGTPEAPLLMCPFPEIEQGDEQQCQKITTTERFFVLHEYGKSYLLGTRDTLDEQNVLSGWVAKNGGILWNTSYGIYPTTSIGCAYLTLDDAQTRERCLPILGGEERWLRSPYRIPVLSKEEHGGKTYYKVFLSLPAIGVFKNREHRFLFSSKLLPPEKRQDFNGLLLKQRPIDVMFLIDGTKSMQAYIDQIRNVADKIFDMATTSPDFKNMRFRFGFRIYRDRYAEEDRTAEENELGEGFAFNDSICGNAWNVQNQSANIRMFQEKLGAIVATPDKVSDDDDYEESLYEGIDRAIKDLSPCPEHTKILFIIGNSGYNDAIQLKENKRHPIRTMTLVNALKKFYILTFFIQTPTPCESKKDKKEECEMAYDLFTDQAHVFLELLGLPQEIYFMMTDETELNDKIVKGIKQANMRKDIERLEIEFDDSFYMNRLVEFFQQRVNALHPGIFGDVAENESGKCERLGYGCTNHIEPFIVEAYIPEAEEIFEDVFMKSDDLKKWQRLLEEIANNLEGVANDEKSFELRRQSILENLQKVLQNLSKNLKADEPLREFLQREGLPVRDDSRLFEKSLTELRTISEQELMSIMTSVQQSKRFLKAIKPGTIFKKDEKPCFSLKEMDNNLVKQSNNRYFDDPSCYRIVDEPGMRYDFRFQNVTTFWIPKELLP